MFSSSTPRAILGGAATEKVIYFEEVIVGMRCSNLYDL